MQLGSAPGGRPVRRGRAPLAAGVAAAAVFALAAPVAAVEPNVHGWWNRRNDGPTAPAAFAPPDVPADGLYAAGGPEGPEAIAAVAYAVPVGQRAERLTLEVAGVGVSGGVAACTINDAQVEPAQNGPWSDAPRYDDGACVLGGAPEENAVRFDLGPLGVSGPVALAIVPTSPTSRAVFAAPGPESLATVPAPSAPSAPPATTASDPSPTAAPTAGAADLALPPPAPAATGSVELPVIAAPDEAVAADAPRLFRRVSDGGSDRQRTIGAIVGGALFFAVLVFYSLGYGPLGARYGR